MLNSLCYYANNRFFPLLIKVEMEIKFKVGIYFFNKGMNRGCRNYSYYPENEPYCVIFHNVSNRWLLYKSYQRVSNVSFTLYLINNDK